MSGCCCPVEQVVQDLNRYLRAWAGYFRYGNSARHFNRLEYQAVDRLVLFVAKPPPTLTSVRPVGGALPLPGPPGLDHARRNCRCAQAREGLAGLAECRRRRTSESRVRENRMHGSRRRREETGTSRHCRTALAPPADPTSSWAAGA